ncbi:MAG: isoleucine--tRNA ligase [Patescibacteria group bacterium]|nr:isoleucine--tRNA ligase [Patescibacteria group bacterium]
MFRSIQPKPDFIKMEKKWLKYWYEKGIVEQYLHKNDKSRKRFSFMDGPITANNPMGIHHAWGRTYKDLWQRYKNMKGYKQRFQNGFDNQGLWVEVEVEKDKGFKCKKDIEQYGMAKFVQDCKDWTNKWAKVQTEQSKRLGYFMDWENSYYTMSDENNYMIWTFLNKCHEKGWLYKGSDSLPWCPRCGTAISQHEILTGDYQDIEDETIFMKLPLKGKPNEYLIVWTTTPWTLPANVAVAVDPKLVYAKVKNNGEIYYLSKATLECLSGKYKVLEELLGEKMLGWKYDYPFKDWLAVKEVNPEYKIVPWDLIGEDEGTGMVHVAPGCGQEDHQLGVELKLALIVPIDDAGIFVSGFEGLSGKYAHDVAQDVFSFMKANGCLYKTEKYMHRYPMCWRCGTKLLFRCVDEWYISMDELRHDMMKVAKKIRWIPAFGLARELDWLKNMDDWCISKKRYWGLALPIWECECGNFEVIKDEKQLKKKAVKGYDKFEGHTPHRPYIDEIKLKCSKCGKIVSRIPDVGNPWLDAGIVPFSTLKYRTNKKYWDKWYPADFITEGFAGQFKNWFYSLIAMSTVLENNNSFNNLLGHGLVKDEKGEEMHKSKGNTIWFDDGIEKIGADIMRWTYCRHNPENDLLFGYAACDDVRKNFYLMLWNSYKYLVTYARINKWTPTGSSIYSLKLNTLDKWLLSRFNSLLKLVDKNLDDYNAMTSALAVEKFVNDVSTWYIRRNRARFSSGDKVVMEVLYYVILNLSKALMPFIPYVAEEIFQNLRSDNDVESVQLVDFPKYATKYISDKLERDMVLVRELASLGQAARIESKIRLRQPLLEIVVKGVKKPMPALVTLLADELNVQKVRFVAKLPSGSKWLFAHAKDLDVALNTEITEELAAEGLYRELIRNIQQARKEQGLKMGEKVSMSLVTKDGKVRVLIEQRQDELKDIVAASSLLCYEKESDIKSSTNTKHIVVNTN